MKMEANELYEMFEKESCWVDDILTWSEGRVADGTQPGLHLLIELNPRDTINGDIAEAVK